MTATEQSLHGWLDVVRNVRSGWIAVPPVVVAGVYDALMIEGWCLTPPSGAEIIATLGDTMTMPLVHGRERPDLASLFGEAGRHAGFGGLFPLRAVAPGEHDLLVTARGADGTVAEIGRTRLRVMTPEPSEPRSADVGVDNPMRPRLPFGTFAHVTGWAVDSGRSQPADEVAIVVNDRCIIQARCGTQRASAVAAESSAGPIGFEAVIATELFAPGPFRARAVAFAAGRRIDSVAEAHWVVEEISG